MSSAAFSILLLIHGENERGVKRGDDPTRWDRAACDAWPVRGKREKVSGWESALESMARGLERGMEKSLMACVLMLDISIDGLDNCMLFTTRFAYLVHLAAQS